MFLDCLHGHWSWWGFFEQSHSISNGGPRESIKLCSLRLHCAPLPVYFYLPHSWALFGSLQTFSESWKITSDKVDFGPWKWIYSWSGSLFASRMFIILLYIKSSQDLCANGFSLVTAALKSLSFRLCCDLVGGAALWLNRKPRRGQKETYQDSFVAQIAYITWLINQQMALVRH